MADEQKVAQRVATPTIILRLLGAERAERIVTGTRTAEDNWAHDYPTDGDREASEAWLRTIGRGGEGPYGPYEVIDSTTERVLGGIGFHAAPDQKGAVEVGYGIVSSEANRGYATAALVAFLELSADLGVTAVCGRALPDNGASRRVMEKAGMAFEGISDGYACYRITLPGKGGRSPLRRGNPR